MVLAFSAYGVGAAAANANTAGPPTLTYAVQPTYNGGNITRCPKGTTTFINTSNSLPGNRSASYSKSGTFFQATVTSGTYLSFTTNSQSFTVYVKGGPAWNTYDYTGTTAHPAYPSDAGLHSPYNNGGNIAAISHYLVCGQPAVTQTAMSIIKSGPQGAFPGQQFDWAITVTNTGTDPLVGAQVVDTLPAEGSFVSGTPAGTPAAPAAGGTYTVMLPPIPVGGHSDVTIRWTAPTPGPTTLHNVASATASNAPSAGPASADVQVGLATNCSPCGRVGAGTGLRNRDHGDIALSGIPAGATVGRAVLVWAILYDGAIPRNTITFQGHTITADVTQTISGSLCWGDTATIGYSADVSAYVTGNGTYTVSNPVNGEIRPDDNPAGALPYTDGASLVAFYAGGGTDTQVLSDFTYNTDTAGAIDRAFTSIHSVGGAASILLAGPDGQNNGGETFTFTGSSVSTTNDTWDGSDPQFGPSFSIGNLWDTDTYDMSSIIPAGQTSLTFHHDQTSDCIGVGAAVVQVSQH